VSTSQSTSPSVLRSPPTPRRREPARGMSRDAVERKVLGVLRPVIIALLLVITIFPFYYMVMLSFRPLDSVLQDPGALWPSFDEINIGTYEDVLKSPEDGGQGFLSFIKNSMLVAIGTVIVTLIVAIPGAYAVSRLDFFGRRQIGALFLGVYFFPAILLAIPLFVFFTRIGQRGTLTGLLIVYVAQVAAVSIYMLRNYFNTIPASLEEAAAIDGCTRLKAMWYISLPLAMPAIASNALFVFMIAWNEFLFALLFLVEERSKWTVSLGLSQLSGSIEVPTTVLMAGSVILTLPIIVMFFLSERWLAGGLTAGAEKG
jgi:multiple sugar transport system permease protein